MRTVSSSTLHQLCHAPSGWANCIETLARLWQPNDALILFGPAAQGIFDQRLTSFNQVYALQADLDLLGFMPAQVPCQTLDYEQWAQLVLSHQRHITWK